MIAEDNTMPIRMGYIICRPCARWKCGALCSKGRRKFPLKVLKYQDFPFPLQFLSQPAMVVFICKSVLWSLRHRVTSRVSVDLGYQPVFAPKCTQTAPHTPLGTESPFPPAANQCSAHLLGEGKSSQGCPFPKTHHPTHPQEHPKSLWKDASGT